MKELIELLLSTGFPVERIGEVAELVHRLCAEFHRNSTGTPPEYVDETAERRRAWDRARWHKRKNSTGVERSNDQHKRDISLPVALEALEEKITREVVARERKACRLPADFAVTDEMLAWAREELNLSPAYIDIETRKFRDYWLAKSGAQATKKDWTATWRNWIRTSTERRGTYGREGSTVQRAGRPSLHDYAREQHERASRGEEVAFTDFGGSVRGRPDLAG